MLVLQSNNILYSSSSTFRSIHSFVFFIFLMQHLHAIEAYKATVFDFSPYLAISPSETLLQNTRNYTNQIKNIGPHDILVFPEYGITTYEIFDKDNFKEYTIHVPEVNNITLCRNDNVHKVLQEISCSTMAQKTYTVINVLESVDDEIYNTNIVFDRSGAIVAKYRKINLFDLEKKSLEAGKELVTFKTDFDVTFGIFTCFDILFKFPAIEILKNVEVNDIIFPTAWFSQLPYLHSLSTQDGYQAFTRVNLLASNYNYPQNRGGGSGIYTRKRINIVISSSRETKAVSSEVSKVSRDESLCFERKSYDIVPSNPNITLYKTSNDIEEHIENYKFELLHLNVTEHNRLLCHRGTCCIFNATIDKPLTNDDPKYKFTVYSDGDSTACALLSCTEMSSKSCGIRSVNAKNVNFIKLSVKSTNFITTHYAIPTTLNYELKPLTYTYCTRDKQISINTDETHNGLITFGFYSISSANNVYMSFLTNIFISIIAIQYFKH